MERMTRLSSTMMAKEIMFLSFVFLTLAVNAASTNFIAFQRARRSLPTDDTVVTTFFYNPPAGNVPPQDILDMLQNGRNFGNLNSFTSRSNVNAKNDPPKSNKEELTSVDIPDSSKNSENDDDSSGFQEVEVLDDQEGFSDTETSTIMEIQTSSVDDGSEMGDPTTEFPGELDSLIRSSDFSSYDLSTLPPIVTENPWDYKTNTENMNTNTQETTTISTDNPESRDDLSELNFENYKVRDTTQQTHIPEDGGLMTTEQDIQLITDDEKTTIPSVVGDSQKDIVEEDREDINLDSSQSITAVEETGDINLKNSLSNIVEEKEEINLDNFQTNTTEDEIEDINFDNSQINIVEDEEENLKLGSIELLRIYNLNENSLWENQTPNSELELDNVIAQDDLTKGNDEEICSEDELDEKLEELTGGKYNTIFFTVEDEKNGQLRVKVGKSLNFPADKNAIQKNENYKDNIYQYHFQDPDTGWYKFGYGGDNQWRHEERRVDGVVLGRYGWHDANGKEYTTHFVADAKGYRIVQPGQEIVMHVPAPIPPKKQAVHLIPTTLTTAQPNFTNNPSISLASPTTAAFPLASLSTTVTFSTQSLPTGPPGQLSLTQPSTVSMTDSYPGTVDELVQPPSDPSVVTGRPPIAYPLPHQSVSHRPGTWVYVTPTSPTQQTSRPQARPPFRPHRPYPQNRPIKSPFRPVNRPRPKPLRPRPLKPLQPNLHTGSRPYDDSEEGEEDDDSFERLTEGVNNTTRPINNDLIGVLQTLLSNPSKYAIVQSSNPQTVDENYIPNYPVPSNIPGFSGPGMDTDTSDSQNTSNLSPSDLLHFINLINSLKGQGPLTETSSNSPEWSLSPWSSSAIKFPSGNSPGMPSPVLRPPPSSLSSSPTTVHEVFQSNHPHYPLDYAFMDEDYMWPELGSSLPNKGVQIKPAGSNLNIESFPIMKLPPTPSTMYLNQETAKPSGMGKPIKNKDPSSSDYIGSVVWKLPVLGPLEVEPPQNTGGQEVIATDNGIKIIIDKTGGNSPEAAEVLNNEENTQNIKDVGTTTTPRSTSPSTSSSPVTSALTSAQASSTTTVTFESDPPATDSVWPYITQSSVASTTASSQTTVLPPPPPPQNFWTELLKRIYHWPMIGEARRPTIQ